MRGPSQHCVTTAREGLRAECPSASHCPRSIPLPIPILPTQPSSRHLPASRAHACRPLPQALLSSSSGLPSPPALASRNPRAQWTTRRSPRHRERAPQIPAGKCQHPADTHAGSMPGRIFPSLIWPFSLKEIDFRGQQGRPPLDPSGPLRDGHAGGQVTPTTPTKGETRPRLPPWGSGTGPRLWQLPRP